MIGVYSILLQILKDLTLEVGSLGSMSFLGGFYVYTGSAMGSGGISARISRHLRSEKKVFWHIDYLIGTQSIKVFALFSAESKRKLECNVNKSIVSNLDASIVSGFGSSGPSLARVDEIWCCPLVQRRPWFKLYPVQWVLPTALSTLQ